MEILWDYATRLPRPWDSPGKNTRVGCHFLLQCMKVKSESEVAQSCPTLSNPMDWASLIIMCFPDSSVGKESTCNAGNSASIPGSGRSPGVENGNPLQYSCLENLGLQRMGHDWAKSHGQKSLVGCSPWGREESDTTERLHFHFSLSRIGEGNGNPL